LTAILAAFALVVQVLAPTVAAARTTEILEICSATGAQAVTVGHAPHHKGFFGLKCADCVVHSLAGAAPVAPPVPMRIASAVRVRPSIERTGSIGPRSPPRIREQSPRAPPVL
jgi:hypothetical protein